MKDTKKPRIRFKGFNDSWEQRKLDTITDVRDGTHDSPQYVETGHPFITSKNVKDGFINYEDIQYVSDKDYEEINKRSKVDKNDILMGMIGTIGNIALVRETPDFAIKNVALIKDIGDVYYRYLYHCLQSNSVAHQLGENLDGGTQKFIALNKIRELVIPVPSEHEQHKIGDYMESLDNLITLHQRECEKLRCFKKSMLEKMFPKNGEKYPEIRFSGFTDSWEQRKLGEFSEMFNGDRGINYPKDSDMVPEGIPFINAGDLQNGQVNLKGCNKISREKFNQLGGAKIQRGDILYCLRGTLGKNAFVDNFDEGTVASSLVDIRPKNIDGTFLFTILNSDIEYRQRTLNDEGAAQPNLSAKNLADFDIPVPSLEEQEEIGAFFATLDNTITLHQREVEKLVKLKKSMLEKMFI